MRWTILAGICVLFSVLACGCASSSPRGDEVLEIRLAVDEKQAGYTEVRMPNVQKPIYVSPDVEFTERDVKESFVVMTRQPRIRLEVGEGERVNKRAKSAIDNAVILPSKQDEEQPKEKPEVGARYGVVVKWRWGAARRFRRFTAKHVGDRLAIVVEGRVVSSPIIAGEIRRPMLLSGEMTRAEAETLASLLNGEMTPAR